MQRSQWNQLMSNGQSSWAVKNRRFLNCLQSGQRRLTNVPRRTVSTWLSLAVPPSTDQLTSR
jgi:hypothetical protein